MNPYEYRLVDGKELQEVEDTMNDYAQQGFREKRFYWDRQNEMAVVVMERFTGDTRIKTENKRRNYRR